MESNAFASLARLKIMVIPVGPIPKAAYEKWHAVVSSFDSLPLVEIPPARNDDRTRFMPTAASTGHLHLEYVAHPPPIWHHALALFRPALFPLGVIGITTCTVSTSLLSLQTEFKRKVQHMYPYNSPYPLAQTCFAFEESSEGTNLATDDVGLEIIPSVLGNKVTAHVGMLLASFCSQILAGFSSLTRSLDSPRGWEVLHSALFPTYPLESEDDQGQNLRINVESPRSSSEMKRTSMAPAVTASPPRPSSTLSRSASLNTSTRNSVALSKKRQSLLNSGGPPNARLSKTVGDLFLLAGRLNDAITWYNDAATHLRSTPDPVWHAAVLEGLSTAHVLEAWAGSSGLQTSMSANMLRDPWSEISDRMNMATHMYFKAPLADNSHDFPTVTLLYCSCVLRFAHFMFCIWSSNGWGPMAFITMLSSSLPPTFVPEPPTTARRWRMTSMTTISRTQIASIVAQAHGPWIMHLHPHDKIRALSYMAGLYSCLSFKRKEVYILRELVSVVMDLVYMGREERREQNIARMGVTDGNLAEIAASTHMTIREHQLKDGNASILRLLTHICAVYGINLRAIRLEEEGQKEDETEDRDEMDSIDFARQPSYGWPELQLGVVREAIAVAEALPELPSLTQFSLSSLRALYTHLTASEQHSLYIAAKNAVQVSQRRGEDFRVEYWSGRPVVSVEVVALPFGRIPVQHSKTELVPRDTILSPTSGPKDPFIYNPRLRVAASSQTLLVQKEQLEFILTLQNPFLFELELTNVSLSTSGTVFVTQPVSVTIPPNSFCPVRLSGVAEKPGQLTIRGCIAQTVGCEPREFLLPLSSEEEERNMEKRRSMKEAEQDRFKFTGLDARPLEREKKRLSQAGPPPAVEKKTKFVECYVVPEQPLLRIRRTSLTHGAVMMYDGESTTIRLTVENVSLLPINFLKLTFDDSTIAPMQQMLGEGALSIAETYEVEYDLRRRPVFQWRAKDEPKEVRPGQKSVLTVSCLGKIGCISGTVQIAYAHIEESDTSDFFYTRQILYPVLVTVNQTLECSSMDIFPFSPIAVLSSEDYEYDSEEKSRRNLLEVDSDGDWCLFTVDVKNSYTLPFEVHFDRRQEGTEPVSCSRLVPPGSTCRITLPLRRISLSPEEITRPIPALTDRQFVVSKAEPSSGDQMVQRELFWYREALFNCITARWKEPGGSRHGELSLRRQRLTGPMKDNLKTDPIRVNVDLIQHMEKDGQEEFSPIPAINGKVYAQPTEFYNIRCRAYNATDSPHVLVLSLAAHPLDLFHVEGNLTDIPIGRVDSKCAKEVEVPICFVSEGQFEFVAEVRVLGAQIRSGEGELKVITREL